MPPIPILVALADPTRCRIIEILRGGPQPVHVVAGAFDISRPAISRHLRVLKQARLISEKKSGRENRYALHADKLKPLAKWLAQIQTPDAEPAALVKPTAKASPTIAPQSSGAVPVAVTEPAPKAATPKLRPSAPVSQMGFDF